MIQDKFEIKNGSWPWGVLSLVNVAISELMNIIRAGCHSPSDGKFETRTCASCVRVPAEN